MLLLLSLLPVHVNAQSLAATGDGHDMWLVLPEADKGLTILHRKANDRPQHFWKVTTLPGLLTPGGTAAGQSQLWLIYNTMMVQSMQLVSDPNMPQTRYSQAQFLTSLPDDVAVRTMAGSDSALWALLDVKTSAALNALENPDLSLSGETADEKAEEAPDVSTDAGNDNPDQIKQPASDSKQTGAAESAAAPSSFETPVARLVSLKQGPWQSIELPKDWPQGQRAWLVFIQSDDAYPALIVEPLGQASGTLRVYHHDAGNWAATDYKAPDQADEVSFLSVQHQLVMATKSANAQKMSVTLWVLRPERKEPIKIGELGFDEPATSNWGIATDGLSAMLFMQSGAKPPQTTSMNLMGQLTHPSAPIVTEQPPQFVQNPGQMLLVGVVAISIFLMFVIWRRDPNLDDVTLPKNRILADFGRRIGAAAIDLLPCVFVGMLATGVDLTQLQHDWPGRSASWLAMVPGFIIIALFVLHTGLSEMFTGKTIGKALCGIEVISTTGSPPNVWQVLARNALKIFDLIAFYILPVLALVGKHRQRLGDLVGKTIVVMPVQPPPAELVKKNDTKDQNKSAEKDTKKAESTDVDKDDQKPKK